jgi:cysteine sulfinate desulfinase/cysteine desulfurase-like protein
MSARNQRSNAMARIYLDHNASTPIDPVVAAAMRPFLETDYGNPSSGHWAAAPAKAALDNARRQVAALLGCATEEIIFTSGGSEANNLALKGLCRMPCGRRRSSTQRHSNHAASFPGWAPR